MKAFNEQVLSKYVIDIGNRQLCNQSLLNIGKQRCHEFLEALVTKLSVSDVDHIFRQVMSPRGSAQASRTGEDTKISQNDVSKRDPYSGALRDPALLVLIMLCKICYESQTKYYKHNFYSSSLFVS